VSFCQLAISSISHLFKVGLLGWVKLWIAKSDNPVAIELRAEGSTEKVNKIKL